MKIKKISLLLGTACNKQCSYCFRKEQKQDITAQLTDKFVKWLQNNAYKFQKITFVGGEPLLYIKEIKKIVAILPKYMRKEIITNGTLLTDEIVTYCNNNDIVVCISYDGELSKTLRGYDIIDINFHLIKKIKKLAIASIIVNKTKDLLETYKDIENKLQRTDFEFYWEFYMNENDDDIFIKDFDYELLRKRLTDYMMEQPQKKRGLVKLANRDMAYGTQILLNGDIIEMKTLHKYGTVFDDEKIIDNILEKEVSDCDCKYNSKCTLKRQIKTTHLCKCYQMDIQAVDYIQRMNKNNVYGNGY